MHAQGDEGAALGDRCFSVEGETSVNMKSSVSRSLACIHKMCWCNSLTRHVRAGTNLCAAVAGHYLENFAAEVDGELVEHVLRATQDE